MICNNCGKEIGTEQNFCNYCGKLVNQNQASNQQVNQNTYQLPNQPVNQQRFQVSNPVVAPIENKKKGNGKKILIISLLLLIIGLGAFLAFILIKPGNNNSRTIMIYLDGSTLESESGIVTSDLAAIKPEMIDLDKVNILLYTGGTKEWQNENISNKENAIFKLTKDGFQKIETYEKLNMGDPDVFASFLKYGYEKYPASKYNLIMYDHGGAIDGAIYDDFTSDNLTLEDFETALKSSPFGSKNKFDGVIFRTCLNGTLEVASIFKDYSDYITFSEEVSYGGPLSNVLGFINNINNNDNGYEFGKKFVEQYQKQMKILDSRGTMGATYSVIDLSKIDGILEELNKFISGVDLSKSYSDISKVRSKLYQYASNETYIYDTIDLYNFIDSIKDYSSVDNSALLDKIKSAVLYNYTNMNNSNGISIYFPYNGKKQLKMKFLDVYKKLSGLDDYNSFIASFYNTQSNSKSYSFNLKENETKIEDDGKEVSLRLTEEEANKYSNSIYVVFEKSAEHPNYYMPIYKSNNAELKDGVLKTNIGNNLVSITDESDNREYLLQINNYDIDGVNALYTSRAIVYDTDKTIGQKGFMYNVDAYLKDVDNKLEITNAKINNNTDERLIGSLVDLKDFEKIEFWRPLYRILDENGNYMTQWESAPEVTGFSAKIGDEGLKRSTLKDGDYYVAFTITDINNNTYSSNLIKVGE